MNKKFSTLVAALIVSGGSFAMVSQYAGSALAESPLAMAAAANLRAAQVDPKLEVVTTVDGAQQWVAVGTSAAFSLKMSSQEFLAVKRNGSVVILDSNLEQDADNLTKLEDLKIGADNNLWTGNYPLVVKAGKLQKADATTVGAGETPVALFASTTAASKVTAATFASGSASYYIGEVVEIAKTLEEITPLNAIKAGVPTGTDLVAKAISAQENAMRDALEAGTDATPVRLVNGKLCVNVVAGAKPVYLALGNAGATRITNDEAEAAEIALDTDGSLKSSLGGITVYLGLDGTEVKWSIGAATTKLYLLGATNAESVLTTTETVTGTTNLYLINTDNTSDVQGSSTGGATIKFAPTEAAPTYTTLAADGVDDAQVWGLEPVAGDNDQFYITDGLFYLKGGATGTGVSMVLTPDAQYSAFKLENGVVKQVKDGLFLTNNSGVKVLNTLGASDDALYLYKVENGEAETIDLSAATPTTEFSAGLYVFAKSENKAANLGADAKVVKGTSGQAATPETPTVPIATVWPFVDGTSYFINNNSTSYLNLNDAGDGLTTTGEAQLWKVSVVNSGAGKFFAFTNQYGQKLAFNVTYNKTDDRWEATYASAGKYNQFSVNGNGEITFKVDEKAKKTDGTEVTKTATYELTIGSTITIEEQSHVADAKQNDFVAATETERTASAAVTLLNKTYGAGNGFGILFKNMAITEDGVKDVTLESNPFSDAAMITAVTGPRTLSNLRAGSHDDLSGKLFLKVSGNYPLEGEALDAIAADKQAAAQVDAFRASEFIAVDTVRYSSLITDINGDSKFYKYVKVKGSEMLSYTGGYYKDGSDANDFKSDGDLAGVTRRIENAEFTVSQIQGGTASDPIQLTVKAIIPAVGNNQAHLLGHVGAGEDVKVAIKQFNNKYYLGAAAASAWPYIYVGMNNDVDYKTINGIVTLISRNYKTDGQVYATNNDGVIDNILPKYVSTDKPEGQYVVTGGNYNRGAIVPFTFTNRESGKIYRNEAVSLKKTDKADIYAVVGTPDTLEIKAATTGDEFVGYKNYSAKELANTSYVLKVVSNAAGIKDIYIAEDHNKDHSLGLNADTLESATFKLIKFEDAKSSAKAFGDTVRVSEKAYSYVYTKNGVDSYKEDKKDNVVAFTYAIYNADNMEFLAVEGKGSTLENFFYCNPDKKYDVENAASAYKAQRFILKEKADGAIQLIPVDANDQYANNKWTNIFTAATTRAVQFNPMSRVKVYAGLSDNKLHKEGTIYKIADNDLFRLVQVGAPMYRKLDGEVYDKVRIYKEGMKNIALFAQSADATILSGKNFLGMEHKADADLNKTMFSFMVDTAFVDRADNYKPEYLLAIDAEIVPEATYCEEHGLNPDCSHATKKIGYATGSYLVSLADSAAAWTASKAHNNPYMYDNHARLGFVKAAHIGDSLMIERGEAAKADTLNLKAGMTKASFALRIVDQDSKSFVMETKGGYIKWLNGVPVVVPTVAEAEVLNIEATENAATANEAIAAEGVQVIGGKGAVTVQGAAGKVITVANVLGQTIANQVAASDNVTIAAPAGIVVVAVEGDATKVVVK